MCIVCIEESVAAVTTAGILWPRLRSWWMRRRLNRVLRTSAFTPSKVG